MFQRSAKFWWITGIIAATVLLLGGLVLGYGIYYSNHALPRTSLAGESVAGMTRAELRESVAQRAEDVRVDVVLADNEKSATLEELGYQVDIDATVDAVFAENKNWFQRFGAIFAATELSAVVSKDNEVALEFTAGLLEEIDGAPVDAKVILAADDSSFEVVPAKVGTGIDAEIFGAAVEAAASQLQTATVSLEPLELQAEISDSEAGAVAAAANKMVNSEIVLYGGTESYAPDVQQKASWVVLPKVTDGSFGELTVNKESIENWVNEVSAEADRTGTPGQRTIDSSGKVLAVVKEGVEGRSVNNSQSLVDELVAAFTSASSFSGEMQFDTIPITWEDRRIAAGSQNLAYQAAEGEKWIDVNLSNYTTTAYVGSTVAFPSIPMVPGAPGTPTKTGNFAVYAKVPEQTMRGLNLDGTRYETPGVPWILYYDGNYALHGAYWRSNFGYGGPSGSHGCVNLPVSSAKSVYDWASIGTPVIVHY